MSGAVEQARQVVADAHAFKAKYNPEEFSYFDLSPEEQSDWDFEWGSIGARALDALVQLLKQEVDR